MSSDLKGRNNYTEIIKGPTVFSDSRVMTDNMIRHHFGYVVLDKFHVMVVFE